MKRNILFFVPRQAIRCLWACMLPMLAAALLTGCSKVDDADALPAGKHPIALSTTIGQAHTRTAAGGTDAQTNWVVGDRIGFFANGGYDNIPCTATATNGSGWSGLYWKNTTSLTNIKAYYPYKEDGYKENGNDTFTILADQSTETNYYQSDVLKGTATETAFNNSVTLAFTHVMSKLSVELITEDEKVVSLAELRGATVQVTNMYTKGYFYGSYFYTIGSYNNTLTLYNRSTSSGNARFQAIAVAGSYLSSSNQIIITSADGLRVYKGSFDYHQLEANKQYNYIFKVTKNLTVTVTPVSGGVGWEEGTITPNNPAEDTYTLYFPADRSDIKNLKVNGDAVTGNSYQMKAGATGFKVTYQHAEGGSVPGSARFTPGFGRYKLARSYDESSKTYTDTYTEIVSDIPLAWDREVVAVGDYFYKDGTWLPYYQSVANNPCIGIVFRAGEGANDTNHSGLSTPVRGYVVALTDAVVSECSWGKRGTDTPLANVNSDNDGDYNGYHNTKNIIDTYQNDATWNTYVAFQAIVAYRTTVPAPSSSSDWYLPSLKQLADVYDVYQNKAGNVLYDRLNTLDSNYLFKEAAIGFNSQRGGYWTSTERSNNDAWYVRFTDGARASYSKGEDYIRNSYVRAILTF